METHVEKTIICSCGDFKLGLSNVQFCDFDCGMMGFFNCPKCGEVLLPSSRAKIKPQILEKVVEGKDMGWI